MIWIDCFLSRELQVDDLDQRDVGGMSLCLLHPAVTWFLKKTEHMFRLGIMFDGGAQILCSLHGSTS